MVIGHMKAHKAINTTSVPLLTMHMFNIHKVIGHMESTAINTTPLLTMHMFLYPHGDRSYEST